MTGAADLSIVGGEQFYMFLRMTEDHVKKVDRRKWASAIFDKLVMSIYLSPS